MIPKEIQDKIEKKVIEYASIYSPKSVTIPAYHDGAFFGYSLRDEEVERLNSIINLKESERREWADMCIRKQAEIERLKELIRLTFTLDETQIAWQQFKSANNI